MAKRHRSQTGNLQSLFLRLEELVLANSGQDEFEEIFKLVIAKLFDERCNSVPELVQSLPASELYKITTSLLRKAENRWPGVLQPLSSSCLTPEHLKVCIEELAKYRLTTGTLESFDEFFEFLVAKTAKSNKGQYFTPRYVVEMCIRMLKPKIGEMICDPACGSGGFLLHAFQHLRQQIEAEAVSSADAAQSLWGFDVDERAVRIARALMVIAGGGSSNLFRANSLLVRQRQPSLVPIHAADVSLSIEDVIRSPLNSDGVFDVIATNPPFAGEIKEASTLGTYENSRGKSRIERDVLFLERCIRLLKPGGRMAIVLPHNKLAAASFGDLRTWVGRRCAIIGVVSLGRNVFMPHTHQKTGVLLVKKKVKISEINGNPVFLALSERDGKDSRGNHLLRTGASTHDPLWSRLDHDLDEIVEQFHKAA